MTVMVQLVLAVLLAGFLLAELLAEQAKAPQAASAKDAPLAGLLQAELADLVPLPGLGTLVQLAAPRGLEAQLRALQEAVVVARTSRR